MLLFVNVVGASVWYYERKHSILEMRRRSSLGAAAAVAGMTGEHAVKAGAVGGANAARKV